MILQYCLFVMPDFFSFRTWIDEQIDAIKSKTNRLISKSINLENAFLQYKDYRTEKEAREAGFSTLISSGKKMVSDNHSATDMIGKQTRLLTEAWGKLDAEIKRFQEDLEHTQESESLKDDLVNLDNWLGSNEDVLKDFSGCNLDDIEEMLRTQEDLEKSITVQEDRFQNTLGRLTRYEEDMGNKMTKNGDNNNGTASKESSGHGKILTQNTLIESRNVDPVDFDLKEPTKHADVVKRDVGNADRLSTEELRQRKAVYSQEAKDVKINKEDIAQSMSDKAPAHLDTTSSTYVKSPRSLVRSGVQKSHPNDLTIQEPSQSTLDSYLEDNMLVGTAAPGQLTPPLSIPSLEAAVDFDYLDDSTEHADGITSNSPDKLRRPKPASYTDDISVIDAVASDLPPPISLPPLEAAVDFGYLDGTIEHPGGISSNSPDKLRRSKRVSYTEDVSVIDAVAGDLPPPMSIPPLEAPVDFDYLDDTIEHSGGIPSNSPESDKLRRSKGASYTDEISVINAVAGDLPPPNSMPGLEAALDFEVPDDRNENAEVTPIDVPGTESLPQVKSEDQIDDILLGSAVPDEMSPSSSTPADIEAAVDFESVDFEFFDDTSKDVDLNFSDGICLNFQSEENDDKLLLETLVEEASAKSSNKIEVDFSLEDSNKTGFATNTGPVSENLLPKVVGHDVLASATAQDDPTHHEKDRNANKIQASLIPAIIVSRDSASSIQSAQNDHHQKTKQVVPKSKILNFAGYLNCKQELGSRGKRTSNRSWKMFFAVIRKTRLLCYASEASFRSHPPERSIDLSNVSVEVEPSRDNVLRLRLADRSEYLIAAEDKFIVDDFLMAVTECAGLIAHEDSASLPPAPPPPQMPSGIANQALEQGRDDENASDQDSKSKTAIQALISQQESSAEGMTDIASF